MSIEEQTKQAEALIVKVRLDVRPSLLGCRLIYDDAFPNQESKEAQQSSKKDFEKVKEKLESLYNEMREVH